MLPRMSQVSSDLVHRIDAPQAAATLGAVGALPLTQQAVLAPCGRDDPRGVDRVRAVFADQLLRRLVELGAPPLILGLVSQVMQRRLRGGLRGAARIDALLVLLVLLDVM